MKRPLRTLRPTTPASSTVLRAAATATLLALAIAACSAGPAGAPGTAAPAASSNAAPTAVPVPPTTGTGPDDPIGGGGSQPGAGSQPGGAGGSDPGAGGGGAVDPGTGGGGIPEPQPTIVRPVGGLIGVHAVGAAKLEPAVNGRDLAVQVSWWSGVEPCSVLAGVDVARDGNTFTLTVREGSQGNQVACIDIAVYKATIVDLGELEPGAYTIRAGGEAQAVTVTIPG